MGLLPHPQLLYPGEICLKQAPKVTLKGGGEMPKGSTPRGWREEGRRGEVYLVAGQPALVLW